MWWSDDCLFKRAVESWDTSMALQKEPLKGCPPFAIAGVRTALSSVGAVNDGLLVQPWVTGVEPLYPTLLLGSSEVNHLQEERLVPGVYYNGADEWWEEWELVSPVQVFRKTIHKSPNLSFKITIKVSPTILLISIFFFRKCKIFTQRLKVIKYFK